MPDQRVDLSILEPFTQAEMAGYLSFLRKNGSSNVAEAVEAVLHPAFFQNRDAGPSGETA